MMLGPMKKKVITAAIVAFLIPTIVLGVVFKIYASKKQEEIEELKVQAQIERAYVFSGDFPIDHVIGSGDIKVVDVKSQSLPENAYLYDASEEGLTEIIGKKLKIPVEDKTIVVDTMFFQEDDYVAIDLRSKEFNMITLPSDLEVGDYIDIRLLFPNGEDYLVVAGKEVMRTGTNVDSNSIVLDLDEEEIVRLSSAIIETYMLEAANLYATKYVNPYQQLFDEKNVDYVAKYNDAVELLKEQYTEITEELVSGERRPIMNEDGTPVLDESGNQMYSDLEDETVEIEKVPTEDELDIVEIASTAGITVDDAEAIRDAIKENDTKLLEYYENILVVTRTQLEENYPVKPEVAALIASNPNIIDDLKARYNIEELTLQRENLQDLPTYTEDPYTGEITETEWLNRVKSEIENEIQAQKTDRKVYLQNLINSSYVSSGSES